MKGGVYRMLTNHTGNYRYNKTMAGHNMVGYGSSFHYPPVLGYSTEKETK